MATDLKIKNRNLVLTILMIIYTINIMDRQLVPMLAPELKAEFELSDTTIGLLTGILFSFFYMSVAIPIARLADNTVRTHLIAVSCVVWSIITGITGAATSTFQLVLARIGVGVGESGCAAPSYSLVADYFPVDQRSTAIAIYNLGLPLGVGAGIALSGYIGSIYGWRAVFYSAALPGLLLGLLLFVVHEPQRGTYDITAPATPTKVAGTTLVESIERYFRTPILLRVTIASAFASTAFLGLLAWSPSFLIRVGGMTLSDATRVYSIANSVAMGVGLFLGGSIATRLGRQRAKFYAYVPALGMILTVPFFVLGVLRDGWLSMLPFLSIATCFSVLFVAPATALIQNASPPEHRSLFAAIYLFVANVVGQGVGPLIIGLVSDGLSVQYGELSLRVGLLCLLPCYVLAAICYLWSGRVLE